MPHSALMGGIMVLPQLDISHALLTSMGDLPLSETWMGAGHRRGGWEERRVGKLVGM